MMAISCGLSIFNIILLIFYVVVLGVGLYALVLLIKALKKYLNS